MCRFVAYMGKKLLLADLVTRPQRSLVRQSYDAKERSSPLNGDGFGIGWYAPAVSEHPGVYRCIMPAWSDRNLLNLAEHVVSPCFFGHIRAASPGSVVSELNCHPFHYQDLLWMHNGNIEDFGLIKRRLQQSLSDELYDRISGTTDSEHAFAVFLNLLQSNDHLSGQKLTPAELGEGIIEAIWQIENWRRAAGTTKPAMYNFAVTNGQSIAAIRFVSDPEIEPISLYYSRAGRYCCCNGRPQIEDCSSEERGIILASEPLTTTSGDWTRVAPNHVVMIDRDLNVDLQLMPEF